MLRGVSESIANKCAFSGRHEADTWSLLQVSAKQHGTRCCSASAAPTMAKPKCIQLSAAMLLKAAFLFI